jgi:hypothetical protein
MLLFVDVAPNLVMLIEKSIAASKFIEILKTGGALSSDKVGFEWCECLDRPLVTKA